MVVEFGQKIMPIVLEQLLDLACQKKIKRQKP
jgi:hypothetical protein